MTKTLHGVIHGKTIEFADELALEDGVEVEVRVRVIRPAIGAGAGILRVAGALADDAEWDSIMDEVQRSRKGMAADHVARPAARFVPAEGTPRLSLSAVHELVQGRRSVTSQQRTRSREEIDSDLFALRHEAEIEQTAVDALRVTESDQRAKR